MGLLAANKGNGDCVSTTDMMACTPMPIDVVLIPAPPSPTPIPAPPCINTAKLGDATGTASNVNIMGKPAILKKSVIPTSSGAPANGIKGIISPPPVNNKCEFVLVSSKVKAEGSFLVRHRDMTMQNAGNCPGVVKLSEAFCLDGSGMALDPNMSDAEKLEVLKLLEALYEYPRTRELLDSIRANNKGNTVTVSSRKPDGSVCPPEQASQNSLGSMSREFNNGPGNSSHVQFSPTTAITQPGYGQISPEMVLAHELVHALHAAKGTTLGGQAMGSGAAHAMQKWEEQAMGIGSEADSRLAESRFAEERGLPVRTSHGAGEGHFAETANPANKAPREFASGAGGQKFVYVNS